MIRRGDYMDPQQGPPQPDLLIGQTIGNYLVTQKLGEGGMGAVYLAEHPTIGKKVALKVLHSEFSTNQDVTARFFHEAKAVNDIGHPNIVDIVDFGVLQAGGGREQLVYFIMEYLAGLTLSAHVEVVVLKALEKRPDLRYPTMEEFMRAMTDPVGYVEAHGGVGAFLQRQLMPSNAPLPSVRMTPAPLTPLPGTLIAPNL